MKKIMAALLILVMVLSLVTVAGAEEEPVYVGMLYAQTGSATYIGTCNYHSVCAAVKEINEAGGILGHPIVLVEEDEGDSVDSSVKGMLKLLDDERLIAICGSIYSTRCIAVKDFVAEAQVPVFTYGSSDALNAACKECEYMWMTRTPDPYNGIAVFNYMAGTLGCRNPAIIYAQSAFGDGFRAAVMKCFEEAGMPVNEKYVFGVTEEDTNFTNQIAQIVTSDADCLLCFGTNIAPYIVSQVAEAGLTIPCMGSNSFANDTVFTQCGDNANGWYSCAQWSTDLATPAAERYKATMLELYGDLNTSCQAACYPSIYLLKQACEKAGTVTDKAAINAALYEGDIEGPIGREASMGEHFFGTQSIICRNENRKACYIETVLFR